MNCLVLKEDMQSGQLIKKVTIILGDHGTEVRKINITTVGRKRIISFPSQEVTEISVIITNAKGQAKISAIEGYLIDENLIEN